MTYVILLFAFLCDWVANEVINSQMRKSGNSNGLAFAKFTPGAIVSEIRGKIAATVFSRNKGGAVIRNRIKPINRRSVLQSSRRQVLGNLASSFRGLTAAEIAGWNSAAANFPLQDTLGQTIYLSGEALYVRFNANLVLIGESQITAAPAPFAFAIFTATIAVEDATVAAAFDITFTPSPMTAGNTLAVFATGSLSAGISAPNASAFRFIGQIDPADATPQDLIAGYVAVFGNPVAGQKVFAEFRPIATASGQGGTPFRASAIVTVSA